MKHIDENAILSIEPAFIQVNPKLIITGDVTEVEAFFSFTYEDRYGNEQVELANVRVPVPELMEIEE
jgi:hypothetical protein